MPSELLVLGAGISGASLAFHAARAGRRVLVLEREDEVGGCLASRSTPEGYWYELGAHTCYNSYGAFLELLEGAGAMAGLVPRGKPVLRFLDGDRLLPGKNLGLMLRRLALPELLAAMPRWIGARPEGKSVREHWARLVGAGNYARVLGPMLSAVPSQRADDIPAEMLFKKRPRRKDVRRSFTLQGGLRAAVEVALRAAGIAVETGVAVERLERGAQGFVALAGGGRRFEGERLALAVPPGEAARLLGTLDPELAALVGGIAETPIDSLGLVVERARVRVPYASFLIPLADTFHSIVTRDVVPDPRWRSFTLHFRPGTTREERLQRACQVLGLRPDDLHVVDEHHAVLPSPRVGHAERVRAIDARLDGQPLALTGNWFGGLAIEDCVLRSRAEWHRIG